MEFICFDLHNWALPISFNINKSFFMHAITALHILTSGIMLNCKYIYVKSPIVKINNPALISHRRQIGHIIIKQQTNLNVNQHE